MNTVVLPWNQLVVPMGCELFWKNHPIPGSRVMSSKPSLKLAGES